MASRGKYLLGAEFKGFKFFWTSENETGGRKLIVRELPNSDERSIEDLGGVPQTFSLTAVIIGENFLFQAKKFTDLLTEGGEGDLIAPNFGIHRVYLESYSKSTSQREVGRVTFNLTFQRLSMIGSLEDIGVTEQDIYNAYIEANDALADSLLEAWNEPSTNANRKVAISDTKSFLESARAVVSGINQAVRQVEKLVNMVDTAVSVSELYAELLVSDGVFAVLASLTGLGSSYQKLWNMIDFGKNLPNRLVQLVEVFGGVDLTDAKDWGIPTWDDLTPEWTERNNNRRATVESARGTALITMFADVPNMTFGNANEVSLRMKELEEFSSILTTNDVSPVLSNEKFLGKFLTLKEKGLLYLSQVRKETLFVTEIEVENIPPRILSQKLYGEESLEKIENLAQVLKSMNDGKQVFYGKTRVLEKP